VPLHAPGSLTPLLLVLTADTGAWRGRHRAPPIYAGRLWLRREATPAPTVNRSKSSEPQKVRPAAMAGRLSCQVWTTCIFEVVPKVVLSRCAHQRSWDGSNAGTGDAAREEGSQTDRPASQAVDAAWRGPMSGRVRWALAPAGERRRPPPHGGSRCDQWLGAGSRRTFLPCLW
jgi:hypothetical protein